MVDGRGDRQLKRLRVFTVKWIFLVDSRIKNQKEHNIRFFQLLEMYNDSVLGAVHHGRNILCAIVVP